MKKIFATFGLVMMLMSESSVCFEADSCKTVRMADIGWTDVTSTTAVAKVILTVLGYAPEISVLSMPVTLAGLKNNDLDVFLGNWMPTQEADIRPYLKDGSVVQIKQNLHGAVFTLAVPDYVEAQGVKTFADIAKFAERFEHKIYGIESGNDGNRIILKMINDNAFGLKDFSLVESSEQAMLVSVNDAVKRGDFIVFLGWAPHPMNLKLKLKYLAGGDAYFGPNFGASQVYTVTRNDFAQDCPNLHKLFSRIEFLVAAENYIMNLILNDELAPEVAATRWLQENLKTAQAWLDGVTTQSGDKATTAFEQFFLAHKQTSLRAPKAPLGQWIENGLAIITTNFAEEFRAFSDAVENLIERTEKILLWPHWAFIIAIFASLVFFVHRSTKLTILVAAGLLLIVNLDLWTETIKTLVLVIFAAVIAMSAGVPLGIMAARRPWFYAWLRPILDLTQTIPTFVYLIPSLMLFGLGLVPGLISTIIFAIAAPIRLTYLGISNVPKDLIDASTAFGATPWQTLCKVELPHALPTLMAGLTQCVMLSLSMVVVAALVGADGLGTPVVRALNTVNIELGFEAGIAIVILAIILDRSLAMRPHRGR